MSEKVIPEIAVVGIDIGKTSFHVIGLDRCGAVVLRQRWSRGQIEIRFEFDPPGKQIGHVLPYETPSHHPRPSQDRVATASSKHRMIVAITNSDRQVP
jgi:hypothetical protein